MKKLLLSILVAIAAVLSSCKATTEVNPDNGAAIAGTYKMNYYKYGSNSAWTSFSSTYDYITLTRVDNSTVTVVVNTDSWGKETYSSVKITKSGSTYSLSGGTSNNGSTSFSGSVTGNDITLGIVYGSNVENIKGSK